MGKEDVKPSKELNITEGHKKMLDTLLEETFEYFLTEVNSENGLVADKTQPGASSSLAGCGLGLTSYIIAVERGLILRTEAIAKILTALNFFYQSPQGPEPDATGYKGFYYHFLDMKTGRRAHKCELSTIDTAIFVMGALSASTYFDKDIADENKIRFLAESIYKRVDWQWALNNKSTLSHGWKPEYGFLKSSWKKGYSEAHLLYILAMGSPTFPISNKGYHDWIETFEWRNYYGIEYVYAAPLFIHQLSQSWLNFKGIYDACNRKTGIDYFENSNRATCVQQQYAIENPKGFKDYGEGCWGFTASDGPGPSIRKIDGVKTKFYDYIARGAPDGVDDGTVSPWAVAASLPFAPGIVIDTLQKAIEQFKLKPEKLYGFHASFNATFPDKTKNPFGWISSWKYALNQGPVILMIENYQTGLIWKLMQQCPYIVTGLRHGGFTGGWLDEQE